MLRVFDEHYKTSLLLNIILTASPFDFFHFNSFVIVLRAHLQLNRFNDAWGSIKWPKCPCVLKLTLIIICVQSRTLIRETERERVR